MGEAFMARRNSGGFYRYDNLLEITQAEDSSQYPVLVVTLPDGLTWKDVEDFSFYARNSEASYHYPFRKLNETTVRAITYMWYDTFNYIDITIDPNGNSFQYNAKNWSTVWGVTDWNIVWLRRPI